MRYAPAAIFEAPFLRLHQLLYERSEGRLGRRVGGGTALLLTTEGRRTGRRRTCALIYVEHEGSYVVVASKGGYDHHPGWYWNLTANPEVEVQIGTRRQRAVARVATGDERRELWELANRENRGLARLFHPGARGRYDVYQGYTEREIPVVVLTPVEDQTREPTDE